MNTTIDNARNEALAYLRSRNIYLLDPGNRFRYIPAEHTDIRARFADERIDLAANYDAALTEAGRPRA